MKRHHACALAVVCAGGLAVRSSPAFAAFPGENGKILFESFRSGGDKDIWTMRPGEPPGEPDRRLRELRRAGEVAARRRKIVFMSDRATPPTRGLTSSCS